MRIDRPTLMCDRCQNATEDLGAMAEFTTLRRSTIGGEDAWDLCVACWLDFQSSFLREEAL